MIAAQARNLTLLPILAYTPAWARSKGCSTPMCAPAEPNAFALFAATASKRYAPMGIHTWEIWNAPNSVAFWQPTPNVTKYVQLLSATSQAIRAVDRQSFIVSGGLAPSDSSNGNIAPLDFFGQFASMGGIQFVDAIGVHPYSYPVPPSYAASWNAWQRMAGPTLSIEGILVARGAASKKIWLTEYGAPTNGPGAGATSSNYNIVLNPDHVDEALQAQMANESVLLANSSSYIGALYWYSYKDLGTAKSDSKNFFGLRRFDGSAKPAWQSLHNAIQLTSKLTGAIAANITIKPQVSDAVLLNPGKGWVLYGMPSDHLASTLAYATVGYMRYDWSTIEPTEGHYNWSVIDAGLNAWKAQGKQFAFGVMNADSSSNKNSYVTPAWVFADGAASVQSKSFDQILNLTSIQYIPVWNDPVFLQKVQTFLYALAQRYDGNPSNEPSLVRTLANKMGYQFVLSSATIATLISNNQAATISLLWSNQGVASLYEPCHVAIAILDSANQVVQQQWFTNANPNGWAAGTVTQETTALTFSNLKSGTYKLAVGLFLNTTDAQPTYKIGNQGGTTNGWYMLSSNLTVA